MKVGIKILLLMQMLVLIGCATNNEPRSLDEFNVVPSQVDANQAKMQAATVF